VDRGRRRHRAAADEAVLAWLLLDESHFCLGANCALGLIAAGFVACAQLVEAQGPRAQVCALVEAALVAHDFARVESRAAPRGWLSCVAIEAPAAEVLSLLGSGIVSVLNREAGVGGKVGHGHGMAARGRWRTVETSLLGWNHEWRSVLQLNGGVLFKLVV